MFTFCERCGQSNRATAKICMGCDAKLPGFGPSAPSAPAAMKALSMRSRSGESAGKAGPSQASDPLLPSETKAFRLQLGGLGVAMAVGFIGWSLHVMDKSSAPARGTPVQTSEAPAPTLAANEVASPIPPRPLTPHRAHRRLPFQRRTRRRCPRMRSLRCPSASFPDVRGQLVKPAAAAALATRHPEVQVVQKFYRALSSADGRTAAAFVIAAKRARGPFNEAGSFDRPLLIRSVRSIDASTVEAKHSHRVSRSTREGTAIVETRAGQPRNPDAAHSRQLRAAARRLDDVA